MPFRMWPTLLLLSSGCLAHHRGALPGEPTKARYTELRGARIRFVDEGSGPPVVLVHGYASSLDAWKTVRPTLRSAHRVLALDLKGFGWSDRPVGDYTPAEQARLVLALMDARGIQKAALVGHSYGASVVLALALLVPERVTRIALYDAWVYEEQLPTFLRWSRGAGMGEALFALFYDQRPEDRLALAFYAPEALPQSFVESVERSLERPGTKAAALATARGMQYRAVSAKYPEIDKPALLLWGREDKVSPLAVGERLSKDLPDATLRVYPACGHFPMIEASHASTRDLAQFLSLDAPGEGAQGAE